MKLKTLLQNSVTISAKEDCDIHGLSLDSRLTKPGDLFFSTTNDYISQAISNGASAILCHSKPTGEFPIPVIELQNLEQHVGFIASQFFRHPSHHMKVIGVTGTNGKTSCTHFIAHALKMAGKKSAVIGTIGNGFIDHIENSRLTTPDPIELQQLLAKFHEEKADVVAMETSSHGLEQGRINGTQFYIGAFTNLTHDHLDYHGSMENYIHAKYKLFTQPGLEYAVLNADDPLGLNWIQQLQNKYPIYAYSTQNHIALPSSIPHIYTPHIQSNPDGLIASIVTPWGEGVIHTSLLGKFNISNLLLVITVLGIMGYPLIEILEYISQLKSIPGRMQTVGGENDKPLVIIDYAHTPDALAKTLQAAKDHCDGELWCVFGCGGDRDRTKRPEMGRIAEQIADQVILTDDNPRNENPLSIIEDIKAGILQKNKVLIEHDRRRAIQQAICCAKPNDIILIAGKGHEIYQIVGDEKLPFSDIVEAKMQLYT